MKSFGSEGILFPVYFIMLALAVYLNVFTGSGLDIANIIINIGMFLIVGGIILYSTTHCFMPANRMMASLHLAARNFQTDFKRKGDYLWDDYKDNPKLFGNKLADTRFREYCEERRRLTMLERSAQCDIDDYLNEYYIKTSVGSSVDLLSNVKEIKDDTDNVSELWRRIQINGQVNTYTPGTYTCSYYVVDSAGNMSNTAELTVIVQ